MSGNTPKTPTSSRTERWRRLAIRHATVVAYLALFLALSGTAVAATGGNFILGQKNSAGGVSTLTTTSGAALSLRSPSGVAPLQVNRSVRVDRLNADLLDGRDSTGFARLGTTNSAARTTLANPTGTPLRLSPASGTAPLEVTSTVKVRNLNADLLDGRDATEFAATQELAAVRTQYEALAAQHEALVGRVAELEALLAGASRTTLDGHDTLRFSGVNLQLVNGAGATSTKNGLGNLLIGYNTSHSTPKRTGSHYLVIGDGHSWTSFGGVVAGDGHRATGEGASVIGGSANTASGPHTAVVGGSGNTASGHHATVAGGMANDAGGDPTAPFWTGDYTSISGGTWNTATGYASSILGGHKQTASGSHECRPAC